MAGSWSARPVDTSPVAVYAWESGCAPSDVSLADLPGWLQAMAQDPSPATCGSQHKTT